MSLTCKEYEEEGGEEKEEEEGREEKEEKEVRVDDVTLGVRSVNQ